MNPPNMTSSTFISPMAARVLALLVCFLIGLSSTAHAQFEQREGEEYRLTAEPPRQALQNEPIVIGIKYHSPKQGSMGQAVVDYHNVDTGQTFTKKVELLLTRGTHRVEAVWGADETLPHGMYVITVTLIDDQGKQLARYASSPEQVKSMLVHGGAVTRIVNPDHLKQAVKDFTDWANELETLAAAAEAAGANITRQRLVIPVLKDAAFWSGEKMSAGEYDVIQINHTYLEGEYTKSKEQLQKLAEDPQAFPGMPDIPRPRERFTLRDGGWYAGDQQIYLSGPCFFGFTLRYIPVAAKLGFNVIQLSVDPNTVFETSEIPTGIPRIDAGIKQGNELVAILDQCAELGIKVDLSLAAHHLSGWFYEKWPDARNQFVLYGMMPSDIEHPEVRKLIERYYDHVMPLIAGHPALNSIWLANEPEYMNPNERNINIFRPWLKEKYQTIETLNAAWGTELGGFEEIVASGRKGHPVPDACSTNASKLDWWNYSTERLMQFWEWEKSLIHKYDPDLPIAVKLYNGTFNPQFKPMSRADEESSADITDYMGISGGSFPFSKPYKDFLRSLDPDKPLANLEYKFGGTLTKLFFWQETMQGATHINWWCWHPKRSFSPVPSDSQSLHQAAVAKLDIQRLLPQINAFNKLPRAPMVFIYPDPVAPRYREFFAFNDHTNRALTLMGFNCDYASEDRITDGRLDLYDVLIMPSSNFIRDETYEKVKASIEGGKTAIALGAIPENDEYNKPRDASLFKAGDDAVELDFGDYKAIKFSAGKGTIYHLPAVPRSEDGKNHMTDESVKLIREFVERTVDEALPAQPVVIRNAEGAPFIENRSIEYTNETGEKVYLTYVVNDWLDGEQVLEPKFNFEVGTCRDLITGKTFDPNHIVVPPADVLLLEFTAAP